MGWSVRTSYAVALTLPGKRVGPGVDARPELVVEDFEFEWRCGDDGQAALQATLAGGGGDYERGVLSREAGGSACAMRRTTTGWGNGSTR